MKNQNLLNRFLRAMFTKTPEDSTCYTTSSETWTWTLTIPSNGRHDIKNKISGIRVIPIKMFGCLKQHIKEQYNLLKLIFQKIEIFDDGIDPVTCCRMDTAHLDDPENKMCESLRRRPFRLDVCLLFDESIEYEIKADGGKGYLIPCDRCLKLRRV